MNPEIANPEIHVFRCLSDNLGALIHDPATGATAAIDVPESAEYEAALERTGWTLSHILVTHEHPDHVQGIPALKAAHGAKVVGSAISARDAPVDVVVSEGDRVDFGGVFANVYETPGHAAGHVVFHFPHANCAFVGDVLFVMGCGRLLGGGTANQLWNSIGKIMSWPDETALYCGHDYTLSNAKFAIHVDAGNPAVADRLIEAELARTSGRFWAETTLELEKATNPYLRADHSEVATAAGLPGAAPNAVFARLRDMKNSF